MDPIRVDLARRVDHHRFRRRRIRDGSARPAVVTGSATDAATSYIEARLAGNHLEAWNLECESTRSSVGSYDAYVETVAQFDRYLDLPEHGEVTLGDLRSAPSGFTITATVTSASRSDRTIAGELPLSFEDGRFHVCDYGLGPFGML